MCTDNPTPAGPTPKPWEVDDYEGIYVVAQDDNGEFSVCGPSSPLPLATHQANAHLLAASHDLRDALTEWFEAAGDCAAPAFARPDRPRAPR